MSTTPDLERALRQANPHDAASLDALVAALARAGHLGRRRGTRLECQMGAIAWIPADTPYVLVGGPSSLIVILPSLERDIEVFVGFANAPRARLRLSEALERLAPVVNWEDLLDDEAEDDS